MAHLNQILKWGAGCSGFGVFLVILIGGGLWVYSALQQHQERAGMLELHEYYIQGMTENLEIYGEQAEIYVARGGSYYSKGEYESAISDFTRAIQLQPTDAEAYLGRCRAYRKIETYEEILKDCNTVLDVAPAYAAFAYYHRGLTYFTMNKLELAIEDFTKGLGVKHSLGELPLWSEGIRDQMYWLRGDAYARQHKWAEARSDWEKTLALDVNGELTALLADRLDWLEQQAPSEPQAYPEHARISLNRGSDYYFEGDYESAISEFSKAIELQPRDPDGYLLRCRAYEELEKYQEIIEDCNKVLQVAPAYAAFAYYHRGFAHFMMDKLGLAAEDLTNGLAVEHSLGDLPLEAEAVRDQLYYLRGEVYAGQNKWAEARSDWEKVLDLDLRGDLTPLVGDRLQWLEEQVREAR